MHERDTIYVAEIYWHPLYKYSHVYLMSPDGTPIHGTRMTNGSWRLAEVVHMPVETEEDALLFVEEWYKLAREKGEVVLTVWTNPDK
jgi:hypothetical protein